jgi:DNA-binding transcriptional MocR family regulator
LTLYENIANEITQLVELGTIRPGDRIASVRSTSERWGVSIPTVLQAYRLLEARRIIEARPQSGFYVRSKTPYDRLYRTKIKQLAPATEIATGDLIMRTLEIVSDPTLLPLGTALPDPALLPTGILARCLSRAARQGAAGGSLMDLAPAGTLELRTQIARRASAGGAIVHADDVVVTCGGAEALSLCLRAITQPGDTVAVESPTWFGTLQILDVLGLKALEIPVYPGEGLSLPMLERALERRDVAAVVVTPTCHNPIGAVMSVEHKRALAQLLAKYQVQAIEDDTYGELAFKHQRPRTLQSFDESGLVLLCGSFSKTLAPAYRLGYAIPRGQRERVIHFKLATTVTTPVPTQLAVADYLAKGGYDRYLRGLRRTFQTNVDRLRYEIASRFPEGTRISQPAGGFLLWVELPPGIDMVEVQRRAIAKGLSVAPGPAFSASGLYRNCLRVNAGYKWSARMANALDLLAAMCR